MDRALRLPEAFRERLALQLGPDEAARVLAALGEPRTRWVRANRLLTTPDALAAELAAAGVELRPAPAPFADAFALEGGDVRALQATPAFAEGRAYVQSLSSMAAVLALAPEPGESVLDLCAAPGSKTTQIAAAMQAEGRLVANDRSKKRAFKLRAVLASQRVEDFVEVSVARGESLARREPGAFDRVLLDAPCSSEGRFHLDEAASWADWKPSKVKRLAGEQRRLLLAAFEALRPGGVLVYSTCTFAPEENEQVLSKVLRRWGDAAEVEPLPAEFPGTAPGLARWKDRDMDPRLARARRFLPGGGVDGFFVARLRRVV